MLVLRPCCLWFPSQCHNIIRSNSTISYLPFPMARHPPGGPAPPHYRGFTITLTHTTLGKTPLYEWSARRRDLYLTKHNTRNRDPCLPRAGFEPQFQEANSRRPTPYTAIGTEDCASDYTVLAEQSTSWGRQNWIMSFAREFISLVIVHVGEWVGWTSG